MAVIIPCAGRSSRYPGTRPKYLLTMYDGELMFEKAAKPYLTSEDIHFIILKEHDAAYNVQSIFEKIYEDFPNVHLHVLDEETTGPAETVYSVTKKLNNNEHVFIKDCDSFFNAQLLKTNHVCVADLRDNLNVTKVAAKSFAVVNNQDMITNIVEKSVASNYICVGGYSFKNAAEFNTSFEKLKDSTSEVFVSHVIKEIIDSSPFEIHRVDNYIDVGTYEEFVDFNQSRPTIFCDIDGTVFYNQSQWFTNNYNNKPVAIPNAVEYLLKRQALGSKIIFTTSRPKEYSTITTDSLIELGFVNFDVLYNLPHAPRVIINDNSITNPYPTAVALNVPRDDNDYWKKII
jgi:hypothetical protein